MQRFLWGIVAWHLGRHLTAAQLTATLGDLAEDHAKQVERRDRVRADLWLIRESLSVASAYRARAAQERRGSRRAMSGGAWMDDGRFALRRVLRTPAASAVSIVTLACAIAAGAVTWSLLSALLLHPLPVAEPDRLVSIGTEYPAAGGRPSWRSTAFVYPSYLSIRAAHIFDGLAAGGGYPVSVAESATAMAQPRPAYFASTDYFATHGVRLQHGRTFTAADDRRGAPLTVILSDRYWRSAWNADPRMIGRTLRVLDQNATIVGIAPKGFRGLSLAEAPDLYLPLHAIGEMGPAMGNRGFNPFAEPPSRNPPRDSPTAWIRVVGRLNPRESVEQARARLDAIFANGRATMKPVNAAAIPESVGTGMVPFARLLAATVASLVLIGCLSVGILLLVRTEARRDELAVCLALGGTRAGLARGIAFESALLTAGGLLLVLPIASVLFTSLGAFELPGRVEIEQLELSLDGRAWVAVAGCAAFALTVITLVASVLGLAPSVADALRARSGGTPRVTRRRTRAALVAAQVAVALVLLAGAGLFARSLAAAISLNTGFDASRILTGTVSLGRFGYTPERATAFFEDLRSELGRQPDVESISLTQNQFSMGPMGFITVDGIKRQFPTEVFYLAVDDRYFTTLGSRIVEGRPFTKDDTEGAPLVVLVSQSFAKALANGASPIGLEITDTSKYIDKDFAVRRVIGVVPDVITYVNMTEPLAIYYPLSQQDRLGPARTIVMRTRPGGAANAMRSAVSAINRMDPLVRPDPMLTIEDRLGRQMNPQRLGGFVLGALGGVAFLLTMLGAYVLAESMSSSRRREFGIRATLGASRLHLSGLILAETSRLVGVGLTIGLLVAWLGADAIRSFLFRVEPLDPATLGIVALAILSLSLVVGIRPALDAARVDLAETLRTE
jgi:putative ABC transport system permease protein